MTSDFPAEASSEVQIAKRDIIPLVGILATSALSAGSASAADTPEEPSKIHKAVDESSDSITEVRYADPRVPPFYSRSFSVDCPSSHPFVTKTYFTSDAIATGTIVEKPNNWLDVAARNIHPEDRIIGAHRHRAYRGTFGTYTN
ncbi:hypothetical protein [Streptomyces sp. NPDC086023]|uniref:hypothetical protein n=1 Tax=Streptomyces sp. NPDC086023 TaxID=3365746 RepID=UPI0037D72230